MFAPVPTAGLRCPVCGRHRAGERRHRDGDRAVPVRGGARTTVAPVGNGDATGTTRAVGGLPDRTPPTAGRVRRLIGSRATTDLLALVVAWNFAVAQPLLDLLGNNSAFFVAHGSEPVDVVTFGVALCLLAPLVLAGVVAAVRGASPRAGRILHTALLGILVGLVPYQVLKRLDVTSVAVWAVTGTAVATGVVFAYRRSASVRSATRWLTPAPVVFLGVFLLASPAKGLVRPDAPADAAAVRPTHPVPVVMVVFDGLPDVSLLRVDGSIDAVAYPNFARLASTSTWYSDTTTVSDRTVVSVPAMLTGRIPDPPDLPTVADHPVNLFTLLEADYRIEAYESMTSLCPRDACGSQGSGLSYWARARSLWDDTRVVAGHALLPPRLADGLPPIDRSWGDFAGADRATPPERGPGSGSERGPGPDGGDWATRVMEAANRASSPGAAVRKKLAATDPAGAARAFTAGFARRSSKPSLHFLHLQLPHTPWRFLPDGRTYDADGPYPEPKDGEWWPAPTLAEQGRLRHLMQAEFADRLLGQVLDGLDESGLADEALLVVTADHGAAFDPEHPRRSTRPATAGDIAWVPLFVREPHQARGRVDARPATTLDILPTVAEVVGMPATGEEGRSLSGPPDPARKRVIVLPNLDRLALTPEGTERAAALRSKIALVGDDPADPHRLFRLGAAGGLVGTPAPVGVPTGRLTARLNERRRFEALDPRGPDLPVVVGGAVTGPGAGDLDVVVAVNGVVAGNAGFYARGGSRASFTALLDPTTFRRGANRVELFAVDGRSTGHTFRRIPLT